MPNWSCGYKNWRCNYFCINSLKKLLIKLIMLTKMTRESNEYLYEMKGERR